MSEKERIEIYMPPREDAIDSMELDFVECETCGSKPGSPSLCRSCYINRTAIGRLQNAVKGLEAFIGRHHSGDLQFVKGYVDRVLRRSS